MIGFALCQISEAFCRNKQCIEFCKNVPISDSRRFNGGEEWEFLILFYFCMLGNFRLIKSEDNLIKGVFHDCICFLFKIYQSLGPKAIELNLLNFRFLKHSPERHNV